MHVPFVTLARVFTLSVAAVALLPACPGCNPVVVDGGLDCVNDDDCPDGETCSDDGVCMGVDDDGGEPPVDGGDGDGDGDADGGTTDGGFEEPILIREPDVDNPNNPNLDSDCDGLSDADEFGTEWPGGLRTDPADWDSDDDGIPDGVEAGSTAQIDAECPFVLPDVDPTTKSNPTAADSDGDCIPDGSEDKNRNGSYEPLQGETNPNSIDSDNDGIDDGDEDTNCNGTVEPGETDPGALDSDGDGINDGVEVLIGTDPTNPDSDGDGIPDGVELQNGTDPKVAELDSDGDGIIDAVEAVIGTDPANADSDGDGLCDGALSVTGLCESGEDMNGNGLIDPDESDPLTPDTDCDGVSDADERLVHTSDPLDEDSDGDGLTDGVEVGSIASPDVDCVFVADADPTTTTDPTALDSDGDGKNDGVEDIDRDGALGALNPGGIQETDASDADTDDDGFCDGPSTVLGTCVAGEDLNRDGLVNANETDPRVPDTDTDGDGIPDLKETAFGGAGAGYDPASPDTDGDGLCDGPGTVNGVCVPGEDMDGDGVLDANETKPGDTDSDCDAISDLEERTVGTNARLPDTDNDGIRDGIEVGKTSTVSGSACVGVLLDANPAADHNSNPLVADTDGDGIPDGLEDRNKDGAIAAPGGNPQETYAANADSDDDGFCDGPLSVSGICVTGEDLNFNGIVNFGETDPRVPDTDSDLDGWSDVFESTVTLTNPFNPDSDGDGLCDGAVQIGACTGIEDTNGNGILDVGETNPRDSDSDCDGLTDGLERQIGTNPRKLDTDNDLIPDGVERGITAQAAGTTTCTNPPTDAHSASTTNPLAVDTDGDGKNDGLEDLNRNGAVGDPSAPGPQETDPNDPDSDNDSLCDGPVTNIAGICSGGEDRNMNGIVDGNETDPRQADVDTDGDGLTTPQEILIGTNPNNPDTDGDGVLDGDEVLTYNTDPLRDDTDCDGLTDGEEVSWPTVPRPDPTNPDSDNDGLQDGLEAGTDCVDTLADPTCAGLCVADANPGTTTNPVNGDSDGDGIADGVEDGNQNGAVDPGELNPQNGADVTPGSAEDLACSAENLKVVQLVTEGDVTADVTLAVDPLAFPTASVTELSAGGDVVGLMLRNNTDQIAAFALKVGAVAGADPATQLFALEAFFAAQGTQANRFTQVFTTWDGFPAIRASYTWTDTGNNNVAVAANDIVNAMTTGAGLGAASGTLPGMTQTGPFELRIELVDRGASKIVVGALTNKASFDSVEVRQFHMTDLTNGSALAQSGDRTGVQCDRLETQPEQPVDFIFIVDDSGSMQAQQDAVNAATTAMTDLLDNSTLDWRLGVVTTQYWTLVQATGVGRTYCDFMTTSAAFQSCMTDVVASGRGDERGWQSLQRLFADRWLPATALPQVDRVRADATVAVIALADSGDQSRNANATGARAANDIAGWTTWAQGGVGAVTWDPNRTDEAPLVLSGIVCPYSAADINGCSGEADSTRRAPPIGSNYSLDTYHDVINALAGVIGPISVPDGSGSAPDAEIENTVTSIADVFIGLVSPYVLSKPAISTTIKVAFDPSVVTQGTCTTANVPRSRVHGFDYDGANNTIQLFGDCRPAIGEEGKPIAVSYRYWIEDSADPDGNPDPCADCEDPYICVNDQCVCPSSCGLAVVPDGYTCNTATCALTCLADCGGCPGSQECNVGTCTCECADNCGGAPPSPAMTCNQATCEYECNACDPGTRPSSDSTCNFTTCQWSCDAGCSGTAPPGTFCNTSASVCDYTCQADCGGCPSGAQCNTTSCACECTDCGGIPPGDDYSCNIASCLWECSGLPDEGTRPGPNFVWDATVCDWTCPDDCGGNDPGGAFACDAYTCEWSCPLDCGGCAGGTTCNTTTCACDCPANCGGAQPGPNYACNQASCAWECTDAPDETTKPGPNFVWDATVCAWSCPSDCGTGAPVTAPYACTASTCEVTCQADCGGLCGQYESCNTTSCGCECEQTANCAAGFVFDAASCGCVCDTQQDCGDTRALDPDTCSCKCITDANGVPNCGGCDPGFACQPSLCECTIFGGG
jgi:hypothetical protein